MITLEKTAKNYNEMTDALVEALKSLDNVTKTHGSNNETDASVVNNLLKAFDECDTDYLKNVFDEIIKAKEEKDINDSMPEYVKVGDFEPRYYTLDSMEIIKLVNEVYNEILENMKDKGKCFSELNNKKMSIMPNMTKYIDRYMDAYIFIKETIQKYIVDKHGRKFDNRFYTYFIEKCHEKYGNSNIGTVEDIYFIFENLVNQIYFELGYTTEIDLYTIFRKADDMHDFLYNIKTDITSPNGDCSKEFECTDMLDLIDASLDILIQKISNPDAKYNDIPIANMVDECIDCIKESWETIMDRSQWKNSYTKYSNTSDEFVVSILSKVRAENDKRMRIRDEENFLIKHDNK